MNRIALQTDNVVITFALRKKTGASSENLGLMKDEMETPVLKHLQWKEAIGQQGCVLPMILHDGFIIPG